MKRHTIGNYFNKMKEKAEGLLNDKNETEKLVTNAEKKSGELPGLSELADQVKSLVRLVRYYKKGTYREVSKKSMVLIAAGLIYFVSPFNAIPDFLVGVGLLDDAAVLAYIFRTLNKEITEFRNWEKEQETFVNSAP